MTDLTILNINLIYTKSKPILRFKKAYKILVIIINTSHTHTYLCYIMSYVWWILTCTPWFVVISSIALGFNITDLVIIVVLRWLLVTVVLLLRGAQQTSLLNWLVARRRQGQLVFGLGMLRLIVAILRQRIRVHDMHSL